MAVVSCNGLWKTYVQAEQEVHALSDVSIEIERGEFLSLCGPSGSGKTTLLNLIGGLDAPTRGSIYLDGENIGGLSRSDLSLLRLRKIGFIFQSFNLIPVLSAQENVEFVMQLQGVSKSERSARAQAVLNRVGLEGMFHRRPAELSGGQQQRVAVARAIVTNPSLVLADEPTANLDSSTAENLIDLMSEMNVEDGITFVFSTHDPRVMNHARRIVNLKDGKIISDEKR